MWPALLAAGSGASRRRAEATIRKTRWTTSHSNLKVTIKNGALNRPRYEELTR
jgi:hypothetical protein